MANPLNKYISSEKRFWTRVKKGESCWEWMGAKNNKGYGVIMVCKKFDSTHRYSYKIHKGPIGDGKHILHTCDNPSCVNPNHLYMGTNEDNVRDRVKRGRNSRYILVGNRLMGSRSIKKNSVDV